MSIAGPRNQQTHDLLQVEAVVELTASRRRPYGWDPRPQQTETESTRCRLIGPRQLGFEPPAEVVAVGQTHEASHLSKRQPAMVIDLPGVLHHRVVALSGEVAFLDGGAG